MYSTTLTIYLKSDITFMYKYATLAFFVCEKEIY